MPRPKGSKNKKTAAKALDFEAQIAEKSAAKAALEEQQTAILAVIAENNAKLKAVRKDIKALEKQILTIESKKAKADATAAAELMKEAVQKRVVELAAEGKSLEDILEKLK